MTDCWLGVDLASQNDWRRVPATCVEYDWRRQLSQIKFVFYSCLLSSSSSSWWRTYYYFHDLYCVGWGVKLCSTSTLGHARLFKKFIKICLDTLQSVIYALAANGKESWKTFQDPRKNQDRYLNPIASSLEHTSPIHTQFHGNPFTTFWDILHKLTDRQTDRQTDTESDEYKTSAEVITIIIMWTSYRPHSASCPSVHLSVWLTVCLSRTTQPPDINP